MLGSSTIGCTGTTSTITGSVGRVPPGEPSIGHRLNGIGQAARRHIGPAVGAGDGVEFVEPRTCLGHGGLAVGWVVRRRRVTPDGPAREVAGAARPAGDIHLRLEVLIPDASR